MEYVIKGEKNPKTVEVQLEKSGNGGIEFVVGEWSVFELLPDGKGQLRNGIPKGTEEGLLVDKDGRIKLVE